MKSPVAQQPPDSTKVHRDNNNRSSRTRSRFDARTSSRRWVGSLSVVVHGRAALLGSITLVIRAQILGNRTSQTALISTNIPVRHRGKPGRIAQLSDVMPRSAGPLNAGSPLISLSTLRLRLLRRSSKVPNSNDQFLVFAPRSSPKLQQPSSPGISSKFNLTICEEVGRRQVPRGVVQHKL
jgi:hypothetical protein